MVLRHVLKFVRPPFSGMGARAKGIETETAPTHFELGGAEQDSGRIRSAARVTTKDFHKRRKIYNTRLKGEE